MLNVKGCPPWLAILAFIEEHCVCVCTHIRTHVEQEEGGT